MIEISTPSSNSTFVTETNTDESKQELSEAENLFYETIKPSLNQIVKEPTEQTVQKIMDFSKSV